MVSNEEYMTDLYGPQARHSEYKRGDHIRYTLPGEAGEYSGVIIWACAPGMVGAHHLDLRYMTQRDGSSTWPDVVFPGYIIAS
jgi:hypothetical protein